MIQAGPKWIGDRRSGHFEIGGSEIDYWGDGAEIDGADLQRRLTGRKVVATRINDSIAYLRLDDGTHIGFQGISAQSEDGLICILWEDEPPE